MFVKIVKRVLSAIVVVLLLALVFFYLSDEAQKQAALLAAEEDEEVHVAREMLQIWYSDVELGEYIQSAAVSFSEKPENQHIRIMPVMVSALEYLENINQSSLNGQGPDLYVIGHDSLEKAYLAGLAVPVFTEDLWPLLDEYPTVATNAVSYHEKILAYPLYFETSALLYNFDHLTEMIKLRIEAEADVAAAEQSMADIIEHGPQEEILETPANEAAVEEMLNDKDYIEGQAAYLLPATFEELKIIANDYDAPAEVETVLKWDVTDIFYNYFFVGDAMSVGGESGDDAEIIDIYNRETIGSMRMYQDLNQFFAIEAKEVNYEALIEEFMDGKLVYSIATTDVVETLRQAERNGDFSYRYGIWPTPDINAHMPTRPLSMVGSIAINGYSAHQAEANRFAAFLAGEFADHLYSYTGKVPVAKSALPDDDYLAVFYDEFCRSIPLPKMIETSNFWIQLAITFARIWEGADVNVELRLLSEQIMSQVTGAPFFETVIEYDFEEYVMEYLDEEELTREALRE